MIENENISALKVYEEVKEIGRLPRPIRVNIEGYAVKVGPDVYGLPSVEVSEEENGSARTLCVLPVLDFLKLRHVKKGDKVIISGEVRGYAPQYDIVVVKESKLVKVNDKEY